MKRVNACPVRGARGNDTGNFLPRARLSAIDTCKYLVYDGFGRLEGLHARGDGQLTQDVVAQALEGFW